VPLLNLREDFFIGSIGFRQKDSEHFNHIVTGKKRQVFLMFPTHLKHKEHGRHHPCHMVVPALPQSKLIVRHPRLALGIAQSMLDPIPLSLHKSETLDQFGFGSIAEAVFDLMWRPYFAAHDEMPVLGAGFFPIPEPNSTMANLNGQSPFVLSRITTFFQSASGCAAAHLSTLSALVVPSQ